MTRLEIIEILKKYKKENAVKSGIYSIGLFGSYARDEGRGESDIDIVIETAEPDLFKLVHIKNDLEEMLNATVDIVRKREKMNPYLKKRLEKDVIYV